MAIYDNSSETERPRSAFEAHVARPIKRNIDDIRDRVRGLVSRFNSPAMLDQYPGKDKSFAYSKLYTFGLVTARRNGVVGFEGRAPLVNLAGDIGAPTTGAGAASNFARIQLPRNGNILVNRDGAFEWMATCVTGRVSLTYDADPGFVNPGPVNPGIVNPLPVGDIFDSVLDANGGAIALNWFFTHPVFQNKQNICFDLQLYDRKRGRAIHEGFLPAQVFSGQTFANKDLGWSSVSFDPNTEIEPRIRLLEVRMGDLLDTDQAFDAAQLRVYLNLVLIGRKVLEV